MAKIQFGLKLWSSNSDLINEAYNLIQQDYFQYIELTPIPGTRVDPFLNPKISYVIHATPDSYGLNLGDFSTHKRSHDLIGNCLHWATELQAKWLILHPGWGEIKNALEFLKTTFDLRILIENMPAIGLDGQKMIGFDLDQIQRLLDSRFGFCFDLNHGIKAARKLQLDYKKFIPELLKLHPQVYHISDGRHLEVLDEHLNIGEGDYDWGFIFNCIRSSSSKPYVTLETPKEKGSLKMDLKNLNKLKSFSSF